MAKVKISTLFDESAAAWKQESYKLFLASAEHSEHQIVEDPGEADLILFTDPGENQYSAPTNHACFRIYPQKCFLFSHVDNPFPILPGVYASIPKRVYDPGWTRSGYYLRKGLFDFQPLPFDRGTNLLFSFIGSCENAPIRERLKLLPSSQSTIFDVFRATNRANSEGNLEALGLLLGNSLVCASEANSFYVPAVSGYLLCVCSNPWQWQEVRLFCPTNGFRCLPSHGNNFRFVLLNLTGQR